MEESFKNKILNLSRMINIELTDKQIDSFNIYMNLLLEWNEKINLTAITEQDDIILKHFIDSMTVIPYIYGDIIDVGTGAGFPGIPIAIIKDNIKITLLDSLNKRVSFLEEVKGRINLQSVTTVHSRVEDFAKLNREKFDNAVSRAVANLTVLAEYMLPLVKVGGNVICMKGPEIDQELKDAQFAINKLGGKIQQVDKFNLPNSDVSRNIIIINLNFVT